MKTIEITLPVFNEVETLEGQVEFLQLFLSKLELSSWVVGLCLADNGSSDGTRELARSLSTRYPNLRVVEIPIPGVGLALQEAWATSSAEVIGYMDLDFSTELRTLSRVMDLFDGESADIVAASRLLPNSTVRGRRVTRSITSRCLNTLLRVVFSVPVSDGMCGFKFLRKECLPLLHKAGAGNAGWFYSSELLVVGYKLHLRVVEIPVLWVDDSNSKVRISKLSLRYLKDIYSLRRKFDGDWPIV